MVVCTHSQPGAGGGCAYGIEKCPDQMAECTLCELVGYNTAVAFDVARLVADVQDYAQVVVQKMTLLRKYMTRVEGRVDDDTSQVLGIIEACINEHTTIGHLGAESTAAYRLAADLAGKE